jgi:hypothetical protein
VKRLSARLDHCCETAAELILESGAQVLGSVLQLLRTVPAVDGKAM